MRIFIFVFQSEVLSKDLLAYHWSKVSQSKFSFLHQSTNIVIFHTYMFKFTCIPLILSRKNNPLIIKVHCSRNDISPCSSHPYSLSANKRHSYTDSIETAIQVCLQDDQTKMPPHKVNNQPLLAGLNSILLVAQSHHCNRLKQVW